LALEVRCLNSAGINVLHITYSNSPPLQTGWHGIDVRSRTKEWNMDVRELEGHRIESDELDGVCGGMMKNGAHHATAVQSGLGASQQFADYMVVSYDNPMTWLTSGF
jgi:hypothetical protein